MVAIEDQARAARSLGMSVGRPSTLAGRKITHMAWRGETVHIVRSGAGLVPTAQTTTMLLSNYPIDAIVSYGLAGSLSDEPGAGPGSIILAARVAAHNQGVARPMGSVNIPRAGFEEKPLPAGYVRLLDTLRADALERLTESGVVPTTGTLCCGDEFIASESKRRELAERFDAAAVDMNGTGITLPSQTFGVPWLIARRLSDRADEDAGADFAVSSRANFNELDRNVIESLLETAAAYAHKELRHEP